MLAAARAIWRRSVAVAVEFWQGASAFRAVFDEGAWRTEASAAFVAVGSGPFSGGQETRQRSAAFVTAFDGG